MRYYSLIISNAQGQIYTPNAQGGFDLGSGPSTFTSQVKALTGNGTVNNPGALDIEFDCPVFGYATPQGRQRICIHGVGLKMISQATPLNGQYLALYAGMAPGLPLATAQASQAGLLIKGAIFQAFGNWLGTDQTLDLIVNPGAVADGDITDLTVQNGIAFTWLPGQSFSNALNASLTQAFPSFVVDTSNLSPDLQAANNYPQRASYDSLSRFSTYIKDLTTTIPTGIKNYPGVSITALGDTITAFDGTNAGQTKNLLFQDLIGQPTWISGTEVSFKTVLRADIHMGDVVMFPKGIMTPYALTSPNTDAVVPGTPARSQSAFQSTFAITEVHHYAHFRQPDAESWNTTFRAVYIERTGTAWVESAPGFDAD